MKLHTPHRIFIDTTYTITSGKSSGIERVVRNTLREFGRFGSEGQIVEPIPVVSSGGAFYQLTPELEEAFRASASRQANIMREASPLYRTSSNWLCKLTSSNRLRKWLTPQPGHLGVFKLPHTLQELSTLRNMARNQNAIQPADGDLFLLPDAYWINRLRNSVWPAAEAARASGAVVASLIYDLIPLTHPEFVGHKRRVAFREYLDKASAHSDLLVAISRTVRDQLSDYIETSNLHGHRAEITYYELGAELKSASGSVRPEVQELFAGKKTPYLMVATFDPRKNHHYLLDVFDRIWKQGHELNLCLVGRIGSRCDSVVQRIANHDLVGKRLHHFDNLSDVELQHCYRASRGVIFPSIVEGFGLPIVEALWFGKKTFASDTPIHREVGQQDVSYFDLRSPSALVSGILDWETELASGASLHREARSPTTWSESCQQLLGHCLEIYRKRHAPESRAA